MPNFDEAMKEDLQEALAMWTFAVSAAKQSISAVCEGQPADTARLNQLRREVDAARERCEWIISRGNSAATARSAHPTTA